MKDNYLKKNIKYGIFSVLYLFMTSISFSQNWTWIKGDNSILQTGVYGTIGITATNNKPGARQGSATWKDVAGNFWLFGGNIYNPSGSSGFFNDLWKYDLTTNQWTWMKGANTLNNSAVYGTKGVAATSNRPGARVTDGGSWTDASGNFWLFGGGGPAATPGSVSFSDLWKYNPGTNQWTWVNGDNIPDQISNYGAKGVTSSTNKPGARLNTVMWKDASDNLFMFGGSGVIPNNSSSFLNDLWKYNPVINQWTWIHGDSSLAGGKLGVYGTMGIPGATNKPGGRLGAVSWTDLSGNFWLYGGNGYDAAGYANILSDLWKYNPTTNQWTWMKGDSIGNKPSVYGTIGIPASTNSPGGRDRGTAWVDPSGNFWLFAGFAYGFGSGNDLWKYNPTTNQWTWMKGDNTLDQSGVYGIMGLSAVSNKPGARNSLMSWSDSFGNLWCFGGVVTYPSTYGMINDLWKYANLTTGIDEMSDSMQINLYPNPTNGMITIELLTTALLSINNSLGEIILNEKFDAGKHTLNIQNESSGIYFVKVIEQDKQYNIKLIKQ